MKQITLSDRIVIEAGICTGKSIKKISEDIGKNPSTVSREIRTNRSYIRGSFYLNNDCKYARHCARKHICTDEYCERLCVKCRNYECRDICVRYIPLKCSRIEKPPYVCNRCPTKDKCNKNRYIYSAKLADAASSRRRSETRRGVRLTEEQLSLIIKGNYYYAKFRVNGKQKMIATKIPVKGSNKRRAEQKMKEIIESYKDINLECDDVLFTDFLDKWLKGIKGIIKPSTWESYDKTVSGKLKPYFESKRYKFKDMKPEVFTKYFVFLSQHGKSNGKGGLGYKTVKNIRGVLSSAYEYALENRYVNENPVLRSRMPSFPHSIKKDVPEYNAQQVRKLLLYAKEHESHIYIFLLLALYTGLRKGELLALTWDDVDYDKKLLRVNKSRTGSRKDVTMQITTPKTASSNRKIPLNDTVLEALKEEKQRQEDYAKLLGNGYDKSHNFIVRTVLGKPYVNLSAINRVVNRLTENAGLPHCTIHGFRHSVASILDDNGVPIQDISVLLGHESVQTTERIYINRRKTAKETTINALDSAINLNIA